MVRVRRLRLLSIASYRSSVHTPEQLLCVLDVRLVHLAIVCFILVSDDFAKKDFLRFVVHEANVLPSLFRQHYETLFDAVADTLVLLANELELTAL